MVPRCAGSARDAACASLIRRREWTSTTCCSGTRPSIEGGRNERRSSIASIPKRRSPPPSTRPKKSAIRWTAWSKGQPATRRPFAPDVLERLAALKKNDRAAFETLRAQLKQAGCRVTELDKVLTDESGDQEGCAPKQADILIGLAADARAFPCSRRHRLRRSGDQRPSRDLADPQQGLSPLARAALLRGDRKGAELRGTALGAQRHRGEGTF